MDQRLGQGSWKVEDRHFLRLSRCELAALSCCLPLTVNTQLHYHTDVWDGYLFAVSGPRWKNLSGKQHDKTSPSLTRHHAEGDPAESPLAARTSQKYKSVKRERKNQKVQQLDVYY